MPVAPSLDHLIRPLQERLRDRQAEGRGGLEVDDQLDWDPEHPSAGQALRDV